MKYIIIPIWKAIQLLMWLIKIILMYVFLCFVQCLVGLWEFRMPTREENEDFYDSHEWCYIVQQDQRFNIQDTKYYKTPSDLWNRKVTVIKAKD